MPVPRIGADENARMGAQAMTDIFEMMACGALLFQWRPPEAVSTLLLFAMLAGNFTFCRTTGLVAKQQYCPSQPPRTLPFRCGYGQIEHDV